MRELSALLKQHVVAPLNEMGVPIDLRGLQAIMLALPVLLVAIVFIHARWKKRQRMKDVGM